jgi:hypothetical protein
MLAEAAQRLGWLGLIYAGTGLIGHFGRRLAVAWSSGLAFEPQFQDAIGVIAVAMGIAVYAAVRSGALSNRGLVNLAVAFQVLGAFGLSIREFWEGVPATVDSAFPLIPVECVWIIGFRWWCRCRRGPCWCRRCCGVSRAARARHLVERQRPADRASGRRHGVLSHIHVSVRGRVLRNRADRPPRQRAPPDRT